MLSQLRIPALLIRGLDQEIPDNNGPYIWGVQGSRPGIGKVQGSHPGGEVGFTYTKGKISGAHIQGRGDPGLTSRIGGTRAHIQVGRANSAKECPELTSGNGFQG
jgi:hypothetical protein